MTLPFAQFCVKFEWCNSMFASVKIVSFKCIKLKLGELIAIIICNSYVTQSLNGFVSNFLFIGIP